MLSTFVRRPATRLGVVLAGAVAATTITVAAPTAALAGGTVNSTYESQFVAKMNSARQANGLKPYAVYSDLVSVARGQAARMQQKNTLYHNPNLGSEVKNWRAVGENVGVGGSVDAIHNAFMNSAGHRANILDRDFTQVGVGVVVGSDGRIWVAEVFRQPLSSTSSTSTAPAPKPTATQTKAPAPAPTTTSTTAPRPVATSSRTTAGPAATAPRPSASQLARERLASRVKAMSKAPRPAEDPLARALAYADVLTQLTR